MLDKSHFKFFMGWLVGLTPTSDLAPVSDHIHHEQRSPCPRSRSWDGTFLLQVRVSQPLSAREGLQPDPPEQWDQAGV